MINLTNRMCLAWCIVLSTTIRVITVVKMLWTHRAQPSESATNFKRTREAGDNVLYNTNRQRPENNMFIFLWYCLQPLKVDCSRLSVVGDERKQRASERKRGRTNALVFFRYFFHFFSLVPNYRETGTGYVGDWDSHYITQSCDLSFDDRSM